MLLAGLLFLVGAVRAENSKGVFSVSAEKTVQFKAENETYETHDLAQWSVANEWGEANKDAEGHNGWYVLNHEEWTYLLASGRVDAANLNSLGTINGANVLIILPDGWVKPAGVDDFNTAYMSDGFGANTYTTETWALMAESGAVFLPCGGSSTDGSIVEDQTTLGAYWASDAYSSDNGYRISFWDGTINDRQYEFAKANYYSIRLVHDVKLPTGLEGNQQPAVSARKMLREGRVVIEINGEAYTVFGQKL